MSPGSMDCLADQTRRLDRSCARWLGKQASAPYRAETYPKNRNAERQATYTAHRSDAPRPNMERILPFQSSYAAVMESGYVDIRRARAVPENRREHKEAGLYLYLKLEGRESTANRTSNPVWPSAIVTAMPRCINGRTSYVAQAQGQDESVRRTPAPKPGAPSWTTCWGSRVGGIVESAQRASSRCGGDETA
jgi:hypothetical protein